MRNILRGVELKSPVRLIGRPAGSQHTSRSRVGPPIEPFHPALPLSVPQAASHSFSSPVTSPLSSRSDPSLERPNRLRRISVAP